MNSQEIFLSGHRDTLDFVRRVRSRFFNRPETFGEFRRILSGLNPDHSGSSCESRLDRVAEIAALFHQHGDLFKEFLEFLPEGYRAELQRDSVLLHITGEGGCDKPEVFTTEKSGYEEFTTRPKFADKTEPIVDTYESRQIVERALEFRKEVKQRCSARTYLDLRNAFKECFTNKTELSMQKELVARVVVILHRHSDLVARFRDLMRQVMGGSHPGCDLGIECLDRGLYEVSGETADDSMFIMVDDDFINCNFI